jgi:hypothetical protein
MQYLITNARSGAILGVVESETIAGALDSLADAVSYASYADDCISPTVSADEIIIEPCTVEIVEYDA